MNSLTNKRVCKEQYKMKFLLLVISVLYSCYECELYAQLAQDYIENPALANSEIANLSGDGTSDCPYIISSVDDWNTLATYIAENAQDLSGQYVKLSNDIDFSGSGTAISPLGYDRKTYFDGDLDGNGFTVNIDSVTASATGFGGLLIQAGSNALIHDLVIEGTLTAAKCDYIGGLVGYLYGKVSNVTNNVAVTVTGSGSSIYGTGGIVGYAYPGAEITGCSNTATVKGIQRVGGIVGYGIGEEGNVLSVSNCTNYGKVQATRYNIGGIFGYADTYTNLSGCVNYADIDYIEDSGNTDNVMYMGGIVGSVYSYCNVLQCANHGDINKQLYLIEYYDTTGGIVGITKNGNNTVSLCYNTGNVYASQSAGGIVGLTQYSTDKVERCFNVGNITADERYAGGIAGGAYGTFIDVYNAGSVTAGRYSGGVGGYTLTSKPYTVTNFYSIGKITATESGYEQYCGNVIGHKNANSESTVTAAYFLTENDCGGNLNTFGEGLSYAKLAALDFGENWTSMDEYSYPILSYFKDNDYAKAYSAAIIPTDEETYSGIMSTVYLGGVDSGVIWSTTDKFSCTSSSLYTADWAETDYTGYVYIHDDKADFAIRKEDVPVTLTATSGASSTSSSSSSSADDGLSSASADASSDGVSVPTEITLLEGGFTSGLLEIHFMDSDISRTVTSERYYSPGGVLLGSSCEGNGCEESNLSGLYIIVRTYDDGSTDAIKVIR